jgi:hypothetical protein
MFRSHVLPSMMTVLLCYITAVLPVGLAFTSPLDLVRPQRSVRFLSSPTNEASEGAREAFLPSPVSEDLLAPLDDLTALQLEKRFSDVLAFFASRPPGDPAIAQFTPTYTPQLALLRGRLADLHLARCCVQSSTIQGAGNGLFASRDIASGELITLYPADAILFRNGEKEEVTGVLYGTKEHCPSLTRDEARAYEIRISPTHSIVGDRDRTTDLAYLGHICNDGAILVDATDEARTFYSKSSVLAANAAFLDISGGCHVGLFALRDISRGSEIFVSYGEWYWLSRGSNQMFHEAKNNDENRSTKKVKGSQTKGTKTPSAPRGFK